MGFKSFLLKLARKILQQVLDSWMQQINIVQQQVLEEITSILGNHENIWRGEDADQFQEIVNKQVMTAVQQVLGISTQTHQGITQAAEIISQADAQAAQLVGELKGVFSRIYNN